MPADTTEMNAKPDGDKGKVRLLCLADLDGRTRAAQLVGRTIDAITADLGGNDNLSTGEQLLVRNVAMTAAMSEDLAARWLTGEPVDPAVFCTLGNAERRLLETLGLKRRQNDVTPNLTDYLGKRSA
ncbi:hypothetical protein [Bradyrhizobium sp. CSS354]|uniref:hypothetical protein n=1 Tax=Bradyrhizobium sp. CSS354 TaxID=2699172 RepID=UPI0023B16DC2|nr:hypothetical protein [Bradyrhizobium sp. CSS354]MDE5460193.1 hypothetical protein [Bradyrhizobium sp. CSS354]